MADHGLEIRGSDTGNEPDDDREIDMEIEREISLLEAEAVLSVGCKGPVVLAPQRRWISLTGVCLTTVLFGMAAVPDRALAWGNEGHRVVALIARSYLTPQAQARVDQLLAADAADTLTAPDMASRATWADKWRNEDPATAGWHYTNLTPANADPAEACAGPKSCSIEQVDRFAAELADPTVNQDEKVFALKMVLHLVGDLHQPLHNIEMGHDGGGNCERVTFTGKNGHPRPLSLHAYWDDATVEALGPSAEAIAADLRGRITQSQVRTWSAGRARTWAQDGYLIAVQVAYAGGAPVVCGMGPTLLSPAYQDHAREAAALQLERAGIRLATVLNRALR